MQQTKVVISNEPITEKILNAKFVDSGVRICKNTVSQLSKKTALLRLINEEKTR